MVTVFGGGLKGSMVTVLGGGLKGSMVTVFEWRGVRSWGTALVKISPYTFSAVAIGVSVLIAAWGNYVLQSRLPEALPRISLVLEELSKGIRKQVLLPQTQNLYLKLIHRHILGEALSSLSLKELKNLESRLEKGLSRVRSRKV
ncbi:Agamous-like MADS-box protein [Arachis hypogaea]|uniref:Agamous-like MADS-box protein n=1 Tax=Arachis hypogaea TaxID=3818 RepID=A0A6B9V8Q5_ARAHY|nr:Agamous-like MADS-box protein [Arachis hypogaea]